MKIYSKGGVVLAEVNTFQYNGTFMGESFLSFDIDSSDAINFQIGDYVEYRGERYELNYIPAKLKNSSAGSIGSAFQYKGLKINSLADELTRCDFLDFVLNDNQVHFSNLPNFSFYAQSVQELADRLQANLNRVYTGDKQWIINVEPSFVSTEQNVVINNIKCWEALQLVNSLFKGNFVIRGRNITIGTAGLAVEKIFGYGKDNGLFTIEQQTNNNALITTRLRAYGSQRNIPYKYYNNLKRPDGKPLIPESQIVKNLMLPSFAENGGDAYIDSPDINKLGIREGTVFFDGSDSALPDIYPSLEGMTAEELKDAGFQTESTGELDVIVSAEQIQDNGEPPIEGQGTIQETFWADIKDIGFNISDHFSAETAQVSMKTGMCAGRAFDIKKCEKITGGYRLTLKRDEDGDLGIYFPYNRYNIKAGDKFVLLEIEMPDIYIKTAEQKLLRYAKEYLANNDKSKYTYVPKIDNVFMARNPQFHDTLKEGDIFNFKDTDLGIDASVIIQSLTIKEGGTVPEYEITLFNDKIESGSIEKIQNAITSLANNVGITADQAKSIFRTMIDAWYPNWFNQKLHTTDDVNFKSVSTDEVVSPTFTSGLLGVGHRLWNGILEVNEIIVRKSMHVFELIIQKVSSVNGSMLTTPGGGIRIIEVEELPDGYKCFFNNDEGAISNPFIVGDQLLHQVFTGKNIGRYWRLVTEIGEDYFVLSKTDCETGSNVPEANDEVIQFGNRTDISRQHAIMTTSYGNDAPYTAYYSGVNSFSLDGKETVREGNLNGVHDPDLGQLTGFGLYAQNVFLKGTFKLLSGKTVEQALSEQQSQIDSANSTAQTAQNTADFAQQGVMQVTQQVSEMQLDMNGFRVTVSETQEKVDNIKVGNVNIFNNSGNFTDKIQNWHDNGGGISIDSSIKYNGYSTIRTVVGAGIGGDWYQLENGVEYCYCAMVKSDTDFIGTISTPIHYQAGKNSANEWKIEILDYKQSAKANEWTLLYVTFKLTYDADSFMPFIYANFTANFNIAFLCLTRGNKPMIEWSPSLNDQKKDINLGKLFLRGTGNNNNQSKIIRLNDLDVFNGASTAFTLCVIKRSDLSILALEHHFYDDPSVTNLAERLNNLSADVIIALVSFDAITINTQLSEALQRCGGSGAPICYIERIPYALIGIPGIGIGKGIEVISGQGANDPYAEISTQIINGIPSGMNGAASILVEQAKTELQTQITSNSEEIALRATKDQFNALGERVSSAEGQISVMSGQINLTVTKDNIISSINQSAEVISINASRINLNGSVSVGTQGQVTINEGKITAINAEISGTSTFGNLKVAGPYLLAKDNWELQFGANGLSKNKILINLSDPNTALFGTAMSIDHSGFGVIISNGASAPYRGYFGLTVQQGNGNAIYSYGNVLFNLNSKKMQIENGTVDISAVVNISNNVSIGAAGKSIAINNGFKINGMPHVDSVGASRWWEVKYDPISGQFCYR